MPKNILEEIETEESKNTAKIEESEDENMIFTCPNDGEIDRDDVVFLCNRCGRDELIYKNGVYMCPACLKPGENFQCMLCDSKAVKMSTKET